MRKSNQMKTIKHINQNSALQLDDVAELDSAFHYWQGASGKRYIHSVYSIFNCPELPKANYILVKRHNNGECQALEIGMTTENACSLNLAHLRQQAARLSANEIHVNVMTNNKFERDMTRLDLLGCQSVNGYHPVELSAHGNSA